MKQTLKYPVGIQTFAKIREGNFVYVDKTELVYELIRNAGYYFLSRPRRFGKSLLLSTLEAYYHGRRDLFKGLAIDGLTDDWEPHPVLHLDMNNEEYKEKDSVVRFLSHKLSEWEKEFGIESNSEWSVSIRFERVIKAASKLTGMKVVILVDEYDKPLLNAIDDEQLVDSYRDTLKAFYGTLKSADQYIEMGMMTGVARFSKVSIFSDLNNLRDISFEDTFSTICGITASELENCFDDGIKALCERYSQSEEEIKAELKNRYDGYHFSERCPDIYNPYSLMNVFAANHFRSYWYEGGTPTFLKSLIDKGRWRLREISDYVIDSQTLASAGIMSGELIPALYQTGYLTITAYDYEEDTYTLNYPNREVKEGFLKFLLPTSFGESRLDSEFNERAFRQEVKAGEPDKFMARLDSMVAGIPYGTHQKAPEDHFQNAIYILFQLLGLYAKVEERTAKGRIDLTVETSEFVYIFEFKVGQSAKEALAQIHERQYWRKFKAQGKTIFLIGANFNPETRHLDGDYVIEQLP